jgi:hypothetical protein
MTTQQIINTLLVIGFAGCLGFLIMNSAKKNHKSRGISDREDDDHDMFAV